MSSEKLIEKIKNTCIVVEKADKIVFSIAFFTLSTIISLFFIFEFDIINLFSSVAEILYAVAVGYLVLGIVYFICAVYDVYDLVVRIYRFNQKQSQQDISNIKGEMERTKERINKSKDLDNES